MGLAGNKAKQQIGADPRNSKWAKNKDRKGYKLLASYGWQDGNGLGQQQHGRIHNIKVSLKDDTLGIGAKPSNDTEWSGLGEFNAIFGRLNGDENAYGMSAEKAKQQKQIDQRKNAQEKNLRSLELARRFVLGDWMKKAAEDENRIAEASSDNEDENSSKKPDTKKKKEKKHKRSSSKKKDDEEKRKSSKKEKKDSKEKKKRKEKKDSSKNSTTKSDRKEQKKLKRKRKHTSSSASSESEDEDVDTKGSSRKKPTNVHFHTRRKFLAQKRAAVSDPTALREILGIKG
ncbi:ribosome biogenesis protein [Schizosaccharomyces cryophilus OY26]|uniref:PinX1-related protein 1 n=1 Tax=Schizosaccharomyces cryophilus (strain OY26 / ATCC MYA-4695 / CBS 11777 / NBRC 106824 / NRRL Y48691) TaxID=653667 RepID=S9W2G3_SCHCR|nr:ribosome biogenesis protein [Schizosaccharomyces cryophilus OY26]EPY52599.1 ribosome biogenesis protein [Schizosaccharomyces cryophilus OY26]